MSENKPIDIGISSFITLVLFLSVFYIAVSCIVGLIVKYIFLDYFARIGWATDFSYVTVVMMLLLLKLLVSFATGSVKKSLNQIKE